MDDLKEILAAATPGPWAYRPTKHDDWGTVRSGKWFICQAKDPRFFDDDFLNDCRARRIDPWEANARLIAMAPDLAAEVLRLRADRDDWQSRALFAEAQLEAVLEQLPPPEKDLLKKRLAERAGKPICATDGCDRPSIIHFIRGDVGSYYCRDCYSKIQFTET